MRDATWHNDLAGRGIGEAGLRAAQEHCRMHSRHHGTTPRFPNAMHFSEEPVQLAEMFQNQSRYHQVERAGREGQRFVQIVGDEIDGLRARLAARFRQHAIRKIDCCDRCTGRRQPNGMPPRAAAQVKDCKSPHVADSCSNHWLFECLQGICVMIVDRGPPVISAAYGGHVIRHFAILLSARHAYCSKLGCESYNSVMDLSRLIVIGETR